MPTIQKANFLKRISAGLLDFILVAILATGFALSVSSIVGYDKQAAALNPYYSKYEQLYGIDFDITQEQYNELTPEQQAAYQTALEQANAAMQKDPEVLAIYEKIFSLTLVIASISLLLSTLSVFFVVPLFFKDGQSLGKKVFGLAVMRTNCVKVSNKVLFIRTLFGVYAIEIVFPIFLVTTGIVGVITLFLLMALQIGVLIYTKTNSCIHDLLADTVVVDFPSQRMFETQEELEDYIKAEQARAAAEAAY